MKALFAHDHRFIPGEGAVWSESQFEAALWPRYLKHFGTLTVAARHGAVPPGKTVADLALSSALNVSFELFPNLSSLWGLVRARPAAAKRMQALVEEHDVVIARPPGEIAFLAIASAQALGKPWAVQVDGCPWDGFWNYGSLAGCLYAPVAWFRMRRAVAQSDSVIYVTREFLQQRYPTNATNVAAASNVMLSDVSPAVLEARLCRITTLMRHPLKLGLIGTLRGRVKGIQTIFAALARARNELPPLKLHILGPGDPVPWQKEARHLGIDDLVEFEGTLPAGDPVLRWLDTIDLYLQPSLKEGLPRALVEAMSRGCPAIASRAAGIPELLKAEDLIKPGDSVALAKILVERSTDRKWMHSRARTNWQTSQDYRAENLDKRRDEFWEKFLRNAADRS